VVGIWIRGGSYLGEDGSPDGLDLLDLSGLDQGLELVGLYCANCCQLSRCFNLNVPVRAVHILRDGGQSQKLNLR
jgi:hypothetical protein